MTFVTSKMLKDGGISTVSKTIIDRRVIMILRKSRQQIESKAINLCLTVHLRNVTI